MSEYILKNSIKMNTGKSHKGSFLKGWIFLVFLFILSAFLSPATRPKIVDTEANLKICQQNNDILVEVKMAKAINIQLYMFTIEGVLVKQFEITGSKKFIIQKMQKGTYLYEFFRNDEHLKTGKIELKWLQSRWLMIDK